MTTQNRSEAIERKIQLTGNSTFVVSLPKEWAVARNLESGATMYLYPHRDRVIVAAKPLDGPDRSIAIDANEVDSETVGGRIRAAYVAGCDEITVRGSDGLVGAEIDDTTRRTVTRAVNHLVGVEISEEGPASIVARDLLDADEVSLAQTVSQMRGVALSMNEDAIEAVRRDDTDLATRVIDRDDDVDRFFAVVLRAFHRGLGDVTEIDRLDVDRAAAFRTYRTARQLERVADHAERIAATVDRQRGPPNGDLGSRLSSIAADARTAVELALDDEPDGAIEARSAVLASVDVLDRDLYATDDPDAYLYGRVLERVRRTADLGGNVAEVSVEPLACPGPTGECASPDTA